MHTEIFKLSKHEMFLALLMDAVATVYPATGLRADQAVGIKTLRARIDAARLLYDVDKERNPVDEHGIPEPA